MIEFYLTNILKLIGKTYVDCTSDHSSNEAEWCATEVKSDGEVVSGQWGDCDRKSLTCLTIGKSKFTTKCQWPIIQPAFYLLYTTNVCTQYTTVGCVTFATII